MGRRVIPAATMLGSGGVDPPPPTGTIDVVILEGESTSADWATDLQAAVVADIPGAAVILEGMNGYRISQVLAEGSKASYLTGGLNGAANLWIGINDIVSLDPGATIYAGVTQWVNERKAEGWGRVTVTTLHKFNSPFGDAGNEQRRLDLNTLIRANGANADAVADVGALSEFDDASNPDTNPYLSDAVHMTAAGQALAGAVIATALTSSSTGGGGGVAGRLARPRMVELWRSQGGGGTPTLTTADRYVDPNNGNDGNNGLTRNSAWASMGKAMTATSGLGVGIGYMSGNLHSSPIIWDGVAGSGTNWTNRMNTHYVLEGETCTVNGNFFSDSAIHLKHMRYLQFSGFQMTNYQNADYGADWAGAIQADDIPDQDTCHHIIWADIFADSFNGSGINTYGVRYSRILGCDIYDCGWWHNSGGSGMTHNNIDASNPADTSPAGYVNGNAIDVWIEACYVTGSRQKVDSAGIGAEYTNQVVDGNGIIADFNVGGPGVKVAMINNITHNTGQRGIHCFQGATEVWMVNNAAYYSGRHRVFVATPGDPIYGMTPKACWEFQTSAYDGRTVVTHMWNNVSVSGEWMTTADRAFGVDGPNATLDAQNNKRHNAPVADGYSSDMTEPNIVTNVLDGRVFDPRPLAGSPMLSGGNLSLLNLTGVTTDFAGNLVAASGSGHVGPYSTATTP